MKKRLITTFCAILLFLSALSLVSGCQPLLEPPTYMTLEETVNASQSIIIAEKVREGPIQEEFPYGGEPEWVEVRISSVLKGDSLATNTKIKLSTSNPCGYDDSFPVPQDKTQYIIFLGTKSKTPSNEEVFYPAYPNVGISKTIPKPVRILEIKEDNIQEPNVTLTKFVDLYLNPGKTLSVGEYIRINKIKNRDYNVSGYVIDKGSLPWNCPGNAECSPPIFTDYLIINDSKEDSEGLWIGYGGYNPNKFEIGKKFIFILKQEENKTRMQAYSESENCAEKGEFVNPSPGYSPDFPDVCCKDLKPVGAYDKETGEMLEGTPYLTCISCGDKICENTNMENKYNCPEDCSNKKTSAWQKIINFFKRIF
ncbi:MAG: hypothetical protein Q8Q31_02680 [Nanoarchaeota archaeon]|nr:hypothetical protein [Nanoarchaeota archaeon]